MNSNMFFEQNGRVMYGNQFGYAIQYELKKEYGLHCVHFSRKLIRPDDPENWKKPLQTDLASEVIFHLAKEKKLLIANIYGVWVKFTEKDTLYDVKRRIRNQQKELIFFNPKLSKDIMEYLQRGIFELIKDMPVY